MTYQLDGKKVWVAGHKGMVGGAIASALEKENCEVLTTTRSELDLTNQAAVNQWMSENKPNAIFVAAAKVGGIYANDTYPAEFIYENLMIESNIIHSAHKNDVEKLLFLGSSCIYPKAAPQPMSENTLLTGPLETTNEWYAIAKIAGIKLCQAYRKQYGRDFISAMPTNLYGPGDNFHLENSHVLPALIRKVYEAKENKQKSFSVWGTGEPCREFLYVKDAADACVFLMKTYSDYTHVNVGTGSDISIADLSKVIKKIIGFEGEILFDASKPNGTMKKLLDVSLLKKLGWQSGVDIEEGIKLSYQWFLDNIETKREK